ncbi:MAG: hypothetical protein AAF527_08230 [Pseudomonadota bacterium]
MAKAVFHKNQRVFVRPVGTWALIERVVPHWTKGIDEPLRVTYDVGLGRDFGAEELVSEELEAVGLEEENENWRIMRHRNKWQRPEDCGHHPFPGTFPVITTNAKNWGGWRVPGAEYDQDPARIEAQARIMANALKLMHVVKRLVDYASEANENLPNDAIEIARQGQDVLKLIERREYEGRPAELAAAAAGASPAQRQANGAHPPPPPAS